MELLNHQAFSMIGVKDRPDRVGSVRESIWIDMINKTHNWHIRNTIDAFHAIGVFKHVFRSFFRRCPLEKFLFRQAESKECKPVGILLVLVSM